MTITVEYSGNPMFAEEDSLEDNEAVVNDRCENGREFDPPLA